MIRTFGTDHASFDDVGVPGFWCVQDGAEYTKTHHSQSDTFDKVWKDDLNQGAQVLAAWAYNTAQLPEMLPRRPLPYQPTPKPQSRCFHSRSHFGCGQENNRASKKDQPQLKADLTHLTDNIAPRVTGTPQLKAGQRMGRRTVQIDRPLKRPSGTVEDRHGVDARIWRRRIR